MLSGARRVTQFKATQPVREIAGHYLYYPDKTKFSRVVKNLSAISELDGTAGFITMNNELDYNVLTSSMLDGLSRSLFSMDRDDSVRGIMMKCNDACFSKGTDYKGLAYSYAKRVDPEHKYLTKLYNFMYSISKLETPFVPVIDGKCYGSAAAMAFLGQFPFTTPNTNICFPETGFGYVPTGGATYFLSRLPGDLGTYLALTGVRLLTSDAEQLHLAVGHVDSNLELHTSFSSTMNSLPERYGTKKFFGDNWAKYRERKIMFPYNQTVGDVLEIANRTNLQPGKHWKKHRENLRMVVADVLYRRMLSEDAAKGKIENYRGFKGQNIVNHLRNFEMQFVSLVDETKKDNLTVEKYRPAIMRCFSSSSLEDLYSRLAEEERFGEKEWARFTIEQLNARSPLALAITMKLVKDASGLQWHECLEREFSAAANLASHKDFFQGVSKGLSRAGTPEWTIKRPVSSDLVDQMCAAPAQQLDLQAKHYELLPVRDYFRKVPHAPRLWLNEQSVGHRHLREDFDFDVQHFFNGLDIDVRNTALTPAVVRKALYQTYRLDDKISEEVMRIRAVSKDPVTRELFIKLRQRAIEDVFKDTEKASRMVQKLLENGFRDAFRSRMETIKEKSGEAQRHEKQLFFKELKEFVSNNRLVLKKSDDWEERMHIKMMNENTLVLPMSFPKKDEESYLSEIKSECQAEPLPVMHFFSILEYRQYLDSAMSPFQSEEDLRTYCKDILTEAESRLKTVLFECTKATSENDPTGKLSKIPVTLENFTRYMRMMHKSNKAYSSEGRAKGVHSPPPNYNNFNVFPELMREVYVKFGAVSIEEAAQKLENGEKIDLAGMRKRRHELISRDLAFDDSVPHPDAVQHKLQKLFTEFYVSPALEEVDNVLVSQLELSSASHLLSVLNAYKTARIPTQVNPVKEDEQDNENVQGKFTLNDARRMNFERDDTRNVTDVANHVLLDHLYLDAVFGDRAYLPETLTDKPATAPTQLLELGSLTERPELWVERTMKEIVTTSLQTRAAVEKSLTREELISYDLNFFAQFQVEKFKERVMRALHEEASFMTYVGQVAYSEDLNEGHEFAQDGKYPSFSPNKTDPVEVAEDEAFMHSLEMKKARELGKPKKPLQFTLDDELRYSQLRKAEKRAGIKSKLSEEELEKMKTPPSTKTVQQEYAEHQALRRKLKVQEQKLLGTQRCILALQKLVSQEKYRKRLREPEAVEAYLKERESSTL